MKYCTRHTHAQHVPDVVGYHYSWSCIYLERSGDYDIIVPIAVA